MKNKSQVVQLMRKLVSIESVFPNEQNLANYIVTYLENLNFKVRRIPVADGSSNVRDNIVASFGSANEFLCLYGHMDTVAPDPLYKNDPFVVNFDDNNAYGLGVADMKGGLAVILETAFYASKKNLPLKIAFGVDEENVSLGSYVLAQDNFFDDVVFMIVAESGQVYDLQQDFSVNYGRKGRFVLSVEIEGVTAHAARSDQSVNAIYEASKFISLLSELKFAEHDKLGRTQVIPFEINSSTSAFSIPQKAEIKLNVLTVPKTTSELVINSLLKLSKIHNIKTKTNLVERQTPYMESYEVDLENNYLKLIEYEVFKKYKTQCGYATSVGDENRFANMLKIPVISIGPVGGGDHTANEWVSLRSLEKTLDVYKEILNLFIKQR